MNIFMNLIECFIHTYVCIIKYMKKRIIIKRERKNEARRNKFALGTVLKLFMNNSILTIY